jgi:hypothetical protein
MSKDTEAGVSTIREVRGKDGAVAYEVSGGKHGEGEASYYMSKESFHQLEREGKQEFQDTLKRGIESTIQSWKEQER